MSVSVCFCQTYLEFTEEAVPESWQRGIFTKSHVSWNFVSNAEKFQLCNTQVCRAQPRHWFLPRLCAYLPFHPLHYLQAKPPSGARREPVLDVNHIHEGRFWRSSPKKRPKPTATPAPWGIRRGLSRVRRARRGGRLSKNLTKNWFRSPPTA